MPQPRPPLHLKPPAPSLKPRSFLFAFRPSPSLPHASGLKPQADPLKPQAPLSSLRIFGFLDPALGDPEQPGRARSGDFAAIATVGIDPQGYLYVLDVWLERAGPSTYVQRIFDLHEKWNYEQFGIETNAFQKLLIESINHERARRRKLGKPCALPIQEVRHRAAKNIRIAALEPLVANGWIRFADDLSDEFLNQLADFPHAPHDDGPDALQATLTLARSTTLKLELSTTPRKSPRF